MARRNGFNLENLVGYDGWLHARCNGWDSLIRILDVEENPDTGEYIYLGNIISRYLNDLIHDIVRDSVADVRAEFKFTKEDIFIYLDNLDTEILQVNHIPQPIDIVSTEELIEQIYEMSLERGYIIGE